MSNAPTNDWASAWQRGLPREAAAAALEAASAAVSLSERLDAIAGLIGTGETALAHQTLDALTTQDLPADAMVALALHAQQLGEHAVGLQLCRDALRPTADPRQDYLHGTLAMFCGESGEAERLLERCLLASPDHAGAHWTLAQLRRWTPDSHHLDRLQLALAAHPRNGTAGAYLWYAAFKELDDLGRPDAWTALVQGCLAKRRSLHFDGDDEARLVAALIHAFPHGGISASDAPSVETGAKPVFIVGMPRSGTTLLERLLGGHPQVAACGELADFPKQLQWACNRIGAHVPDQDMARMATRIDSHQLGQRYLAQTRWRAVRRRLYLDKLPRNFWNIGFIVRSLPNAHILHMVRDPMDTCFSNLKELFGKAYAYSYNLAELGQHHARYQQMMAHWHSAFPGRILDVHYEALVRDPEQTIRRVLAHCGLDWDPACLGLEHRAGPVATASTVQVREPIHQRSIGGWRRYERQLQALRLHLAQD